MATALKYQSSQAPSTLAPYLRKVAQHEIPSPEKASELAILAQKGDDDALREVVTGNLRLVISLAKKYTNQGIPLSDLIQEGNIGLIEAARRFDPTRNCRFSTFATWWIRQALTRALANDSRTIRLPVYLSNTVSQHNRLASKHEATTGESPTLDDLLPKLVVDKNGKKKAALATSNAKNLVKTALAMAQPLSSLNTVVRGVENDQVELHNLIPSDDQDFSDNHSRKDYVRWILSHLSDREARIVDHRFAIFARKKKTLRELADDLGCSRETIRLHEKRAIEKLKAIVKSALERGEFR